MVSIWSFIPHLREVDDPNDYSKPYAYDDEPEKRVSIENNPNYIQLDGKLVKIREYRDEANRPWWKFFDEFEYRETTEESKNYNWFQWFEPGTSPAEKKLLFKLDILIAFYSFLGYWIKFIDSQNINNAYVSNMKEDLNMHGNDLINTQVLFNAAAVLFCFPAMYLLPRVPLNYLLFTMELGWSLFTLGLFKVTSVGQLQALRWFVGSFESMYFPVIHYLLGSWYKSSEISRRGAFFYIGQFLGVLTAGLIASATFENLDGKIMAGWRWMYVVNFSMSSVVAVMAVFFVPNTPFKCYSLFLTDEEIILARQRMYKNGSDTREENKSFFDKSVWKKVFKSWKIWYFSIITMLSFNTNNASSGSFTLWLKSLDRWSIGKVNQLGSIPAALGIFYCVFVCFGADFTRKRFGFIMFSFVMTFISNTILAVWDVPYGAKWFAYCSGYWGWSQSSVLYPLLSDFFRRDNELRAIGFTIIYIAGLQSSVWIGRLVWPTVDSPRFLKGFSSCAAFAMGFNILLSLAYFWYKRDERKDALLNGIYVYNSGKGETPLSVSSGSTDGFSPEVDEVHEEKHTGSPVAKSIASVDL